MIYRSVFKAAGVLTLALAVVGPVKAQQVTGVLGSPSATTTVSNKQLPAPDPKFGGIIKDDALQSKPGGRRASCRRRARPTCC